MADDRRVAEQALDLAVAQLGHPAEVEAGERPPERLPLAEDRQPREPGLEPLEAELLEEPDVVDDRHAPFVVVVRPVLEVVAASPPAAGDAVLVADEPRVQRFAVT